LNAAYASANAGQGRAIHGTIPRPESLTYMVKLCPV